MTPGHWSQMATRWSLVGPPLRPDTEDIALYRQAVAPRLSAHGSPPQVLILGVTPELYHLGWPPGTCIQALDNSRKMIDAVWPGSPGTALQGSWTAIPLATSSCDIVLCDGGMGMLSYPDGQKKLLHELARVLAPSGILAIRLFAPTGRTGSIGEIFDDLQAGHIASLDILKLRLWGAMHRDPRTGIQPRAVVEKILATLNSFEKLADVSGWPPAHVRTLTLHLSNTACYHLTEADEIIRMAVGSLGGFELLNLTEPGYRYGNCCPHVSFRRQAIEERA
jgi:SAM-dependent methyltransferase